MRQLRLAVALLAFLTTGPTPGVECNPSPADCIETLTIVRTFAQLYAPPGTVCFQCEFSNEVATDSMFQLDNVGVDETRGVVVNGVLVLFNTTELFNTITPVTLRCTSGRSYQTFTYLKIFQPPVISGESTLTEGGSLSLDCDPSNSAPLPTVHWSTSQGEVISDRSIEIEGIDRSEAGTYTCVVTLDGDTRSSTVDVIVKYAPVVTADSEGSVRSPLGRTLQLSCSLLGVPPPDSVTWTHNGTTLNVSDPDITISSTSSTTTLRRANLLASGGGPYVCTASNEVGSDNAHAIVRVQLPPGPPTNLVVMSKTTTTLVISWSNPEFTGFSPIASFRVRITGAGEENSVTFNGDATTTEYTVESLIPFNVYTLHLYVRNAAGLESQSAEAQDSTLTLRLPTIEDPVIAAVNSTAIRLEWQAPNYDSFTTAPVDSYMLTYRRQSGGDPTSLILFHQVTDRTVGSLEKGTVYVFTITALNIAGSGDPYVFPSTTTLVDPPTVPRNFIVTSPDPFSLDLSWTQPADDGGRPIGSYRIQLRNVSGGDRSAYVVAEPPGHATQHLLQNLMQNTTYEVGIVAINTDGQGSVSVTITKTTRPVGPPQTPDTLSTPDRKITNTSAIVSWKAAGGYPIRYILQYKQSSDDWRNDVTTVTLTLDSSVLTHDSNNMLTHTLAGLQPLTTYDVRMQSQNILGLSEFSSVASFRTFGDIKINGPPQNEPVQAGETVILTCSLTGADSGANVEYSWTRDGQYINTTDGVLVIPDAREEDAGVYTCTANGMPETLTLKIQPSESGVALSGTLLGVIVGSTIGGVLLIIVICVLIGILIAIRKSSSSISLNRVNTTDVDRAATVEHIYETLPMANMSNNYQKEFDFKPVHMLQNEAYGTALPPVMVVLDDVEELPGTLDDEYMVLQEGVTRGHEEIYDQTHYNQVQQSKAEKSDEEYEDAYETDSNGEEVDGDKA